MTMTATMAERHEQEVGRRFDQLHARFKSVVPPDDPRLSALLATLEPVAGRRVLDLGCGKGRFAMRLMERGATVVGLDLSPLMLDGASGLDRVRASALRLPFAEATFDAISAVEVFEHLPRIDMALDEIARVLRPGGIVAILDKNAGSLNADRPWLPNLIVKWIDTRRGRWMYPSNGPVRERWFWPRRFAGQLAGRFHSVTYQYVLSSHETATWLLRRVPCTRLMTLWSARRPGPAREGARP